MNDLHSALDRAAGPHSTSDTDVASDLARGRRALGATRRRRGAIVAAGVAVIAGAGIGVPTLLPHHDTPQAQHHTTLRLVSLDTPLRSGVYTFDKVPDGWTVQGERPDGVTIAPADGSVSPDPTDFIGKLEVFYDQNPLTGTQFASGGRTFHVRGDSGYTTIAAAAQPGEPAGEVAVQYPDDAGWTRDQMTDFLDSVHVGPGAQPGVG